MTLPKSFHHFFFRAILLLLTVAVLFGIPTPHIAEAAASPYVTAQGTKLYLNGIPYLFTGVNAYQLGTLWGTNAGCGAQVDNLDGFFSSLRPNSVTRIWAFQGSIGTNVHSKQIDFVPLDRVIKAAEARGQKLIVAFSGQSGTCDDGHWKDSAWYSGGYKQAFNDDGRGLAPLPYLEYVKQVVTRYKDSPAIAIWEPVSEPEASDCAAGYKADGCYGHVSCTDQTKASSALRGFFDAIGTEINKIDPNHLIGSGVIGDGQCGTAGENYSYVHQSPGIDVASFHDYGRDTQPMPGDVWNGLQKRINQMKTINKPLIIGEAGINALSNSASCRNLTSRRDLIKAKMDAQFAAGIAGYVVWNWVGSPEAACTHAILNGDPILTLIRDYPLPTPAVPTPSSAPASTSQKLGGIDLTSYCSSLKLPASAITGNNWTCGINGQVINLSNACIWQYKNQQAVAKQDVAGNQFSWSCYKTTVQLGGIDLARYCTTQNLPAGVVTGSNWTCGPGGVLINMTHACQWQYKDTAAFGKQETAGNPYTWSCYR